MIPLLRPSDLCASPAQPCPSLAVIGSVPSSSHHFFSTNTSTTTTTYNNNYNNNNIYLARRMSPALSSSTNTMSPLLQSTADSSPSTSRPVSPMPYSQQQQQQQQQMTNNTQEVIALIDEMRQLDVWVSQIDECSENARSLVWRQLTANSIKNAYPMGGATMIIEVYDSLAKCTSKFRPYFNSLVRQTNSDIHAIKMLHLAFVEASQGGSEIFQQISPQLKAEASDATNPYMVSNNMFHSSNIWGHNLPSVLQQLLCLTAWAPQLDALPTAMRKAIWDNCNSFAPFKSSTEGTKLNNFTKVIKGWTNNPVNNMLPITTLFASIGYLSEQRVLNNVQFLYPQSDYSMFNTSGIAQSQSQSEDGEDLEQESYTSPAQPTKRVKRSHSRSEVGERVPSMSPLPTPYVSTTPLCVTPGSSYEDSSDNESITESFNHNQSKKQQQQPQHIPALDSISSMIERAMTSGKTSPTTTNQSNMYIPTRRVSTDYDHVPMTKHIANVQQHDATLSVPVVVATKSNGAGCASLDVLALTAFQFEHLDESNNTNLNNNNPSIVITNPSTSSGAKQQQDGAAMNIKNILCS
ncbi:hypothetical protein SAMD00019534_020260 [Acytostelium subglobosum LB1]|uniref:hypothetical protein n=1 Tax=Acytostelium subglobosum LB1 TaxID=1410327 RepID=UPI0006449539|nr:hypothetical protein SAMD00019534_020260 [Acytostelium subglobosum LB1]GAM18851.1 hypothetical protein SAMD00019534_020260 [Acytostelium subglobosum LB1]|eukprot:XP_012758071.1 hypothetical protein SAMD00019534_020260 [Acytostelium subglobosum LB1]